MTFLHRDGENAHKYCSRACAFTYRYPRRVRPSLPARICVGCGVSVGLHALRCKTCRKVLACTKALARSKSKKVIQARACQGCGVTFTPTYGVKRRAFCSDQCGRRMAHRQGRHRRRARGRGGRVSSHAVYTRDQWTCGLCHQPIRRTLPYTHPMSASLDHIVPLALGGTHDMVNVQAAHRSCNGKKKTEKCGSQLRLIG